MKKFVLLLATAAFMTVLFSGCKDGMKFGSKEFEPESDVDSVSYAIGMDIGDNFKTQESEVNTEALAAGLADYLAENSLFSDEEKNQIIMKFQQDMKMKQMEASMGKAEENKKAGAAFLAENKKKEGVIETETGLQYKVVTEGSGPMPASTDVVTVHYRGKLLDGTVFDASYDRGEPIEFPLDRVIPGWTEGLQLMNVGSKYEFYISSELAYGDQGAGETIPAGATLIFEVELLSFKPAEAPQE